MAASVVAKHSSMRRRGGIGLRRHKDRGRRDRDLAEKRVRPGRIDLDGFGLARRRKRSGSRPSAGNRSSWPAWRGPSPASGRVFRSFSSSSAKAVMRKNHWVSIFFSTGAPERQSAVDDLLVGEHRHVDGIPVDRALLAIGEAEPQEIEEHALLVAVIGRVAGRELAAPVEREAEQVELLPSSRRCCRRSSPGWMPRSAAAFSAGRPKASQPKGCSTLKPAMRLKRATTSPMT